MLVNSAYMRFFIDRLVVKCGISVMLMAIFFSVSAFAAHPDRASRAKQINLIIRQIGHRLLLQAGDSSSRVMPVTEVREGTFLLSFENEFVFSHDSLWQLTHDLLPESRFPSGYTVTVHDCNHGYIVYGFEVNGSSPDILACSGRNQAPGCYTIEFAFAELYAEAESKKALPNKSKVADVAEEPGSHVATGEEEEHPKEPGTGTNTDHPIEATRAMPDDNPLAVTKAATLGPATFDHPLISIVGSGMLVLLGVTLVVVRFGQILAPVKKHDTVTIAAPVSQLPQLGRFLFDVTNQRLLLDSEVIALTDKECRILELLNQNFGELISRETLMQEVWINEGVITGRSLDMFVSKLRKKLSGDPELRITNVHGKGYKLVSHLG